MICSFLAKPNSFKGILLMRLLIEKGGVVLFNLELTVHQYHFTGWHGPLQPTNLLSRSLVDSLGFEIPGIELYSYYPGGKNTVEKFVDMHTLPRLLGWAGPVIDSLNEGCIHYVIPTETAD
jgi:hypothetical protein